MKIGIAQIEPTKGDVVSNIRLHERYIRMSVSENADFIGFPELSLTGYEPELARELAMDKNDSRLDVFQNLSNEHNITIAIGAPVELNGGIAIAMIVFCAKKTRSIYVKQQLHEDEWPYFIEGQKQILIDLDKVKVAPAICYESLQEPHIENAKNMGGDVYFASVAKPKNGVKKAVSYFPLMATKYTMPILMSNCIGFCDNFKSVGQSAIWNSRGELVGKLGADNAGILIYNTQTEKIIVKEITRSINGI